jgi:hypothetical protein
MPANVLYLSQEKGKEIKKMYEIITTNSNGNTFHSQHFDSPWAANMIAIGYMRNYPELTRAEVVNRITGEVEKIYTRG